ncbi:thaumatin-like protein 1b [Neltuma alba]|uniref:thaumatin-like protein 1b n=1 Tax=Neltuma alba TaxID=207710 RepID=UPI0010A572E1|nr:thaumatin-like protein 1b [Prosopis alba]
MDPPPQPSLYKYPILLVTSFQSSYISLSIMASSAPFATTFFSLLLLRFLLTGSYSATFTIVNKCSYPVWPGILSGAGTPQLSTTGFVLQPAESNAITAPAGWSGRLWGRTLCSQDSTGKFSCVTGDCGSSGVECGGGGAAPPATLAEFTLNGAGGMDFYDVSLVDGYNLPMTVEPQGGAGGGNCTSTGCVVDLNGPCPTELKVTYGASGGEEGVACKSACEAFGEAEYCCSGEYATPQTCKPSRYSEFFKAACPRAYSYAYDDGTSTFTCSSANYVVTFCAGPTTSVMKAGKEKYAEAADVAGGEGVRWRMEWALVGGMAVFGMLMS